MSVAARDGFTKSQKNMMMLSEETRKGLQLTGIVAIEEKHT